MRGVLLAPPRVRFSPHLIPLQAPATPPRIPLISGVFEFEPLHDVGEHGRDDRGRRLVAPAEVALDGALVLTGDIDKPCDGLLPLRELGEVAEGNSLARGRDFSRGQSSPLAI